jgi:cell division septal protein FtsQ
MTSTPFPRRSQSKIRFRFHRRRRRSERLEAYYSTLPGFVTTDQEPRLPLPSWDVIRAWFAARQLSLALLLVLALICAWFFGTEDFYVYSAHVEGNQFLTSEEIYNQAQLEGLSIFWVNPPALAASLKQNPLIKEATVSAYLPHHVSIVIVERQPVAVWQSGNDSLYVDAEGALFPLRGDATGAVVIRDLRGDKIAPGNVVDTEAVQTALELAKLVPTRRAFDWEPAAGISFITDAGWRVSFGDHYRLDVKAAAYDAFTRQIAPFEKIELLDLSAPEHPYYRVLPSTDDAPTVAQ